MEKKLEYNRKSSKRFGWTPEWFGADSFDSSLIEKIIEFQKESGVDQDGLVGPGTYRRIEAHQYALECYKPPKRNRRKGDKNIIYNGDKFSINWDKVILWDQRGGFECKPNTYYDWSDKPLRKPIQFVTTQKFLDHFNIEKLSDLPTVDELGSAGLIDDSSIDSSIIDSA